MLTIFQFPFWHQETARPRLGGCGPTFAMIDRQEKRCLRLCGSLIRRIVAASIHGNICATFMDPCKPMVMPDSIIFMRVDRSRRPPVGLMCVASSTIYT